MTALFLAAVLAQSQPTCAELLDAGTPGPAVLVEPGAPLADKAWLMTPAKMCEVGQRVAHCEARAAELEARAVGPAWWVVAVAGGVALAAGAVATYAVCRAAHCAP